MRDLTFEQKMKILEFIATRTTPWYRMDQVLIRAIEILFRVKDYE